MIRVVCTVEELLSARPVAGCSLETRIVVVPLFETGPDLSRGEGFSQQTVTRPDGLAAFDFDVSGPYSRIVRPVTFIEFRARFAGLDRIRASRQMLRDGDTFETRILLDYAKSIIGDTTPTSTTLWFCLHTPELTEDEYVCEIDTAETGAGPQPLQSHVLHFTASEANTTVLRITGLQPGTRYQYALRHRTREQLGQPRQGRELTAGEFMTFSDERDLQQIRFAFASCHCPVHHSLLSARDPDSASEEALDRWAELSTLSTSRFDMLLLTGDQTYCDGIERNFPEDNWFTRFAKRYHQVLEYRDMRRILASRPSYSILDDHDVQDGLGTKKISDTIIRQGLLAYRVFQHSRNPGGPDGPFHYHFRRGSTAFFVLDVRTHRAPDPEGVAYPVLGRQQFDDLRAWSQSREARDADVIVLVTSVPFAWLPIEVVREAFKDIGEEVGGFVGSLPNSLVMGALGYGLGNVVGGKIFEALLFNKHDLEDQWTFGPNQKDLTRVLRLLFDLGNDLDAVTGEPRLPRRKRAVFVIGGDVHMGAVHTIRSSEDGTKGRRDHRANPILYALTSSPISHPPEEDPRYKAAIQHAQGDINLNLIDAGRAFVNLGLSEDGLLDILGSKPASFVLDTEGERLYKAEVCGLVVEKRNYGLFSMSRQQTEDRQYEFSFSIEGPDSRTAAAFVLNLDATRVVASPPLSVRTVARRCLRRSGALSLRRDILATPGRPPGGSLRTTLRFIVLSRCT